MNSLIPWCPIKARNGSYEVVTREGHPVTDWHMFENIDPYPLRAVVEYPTGSKIVEFSRTGGYLDGDDEIAEDESDLMLKLVTEHINGFLVKKGLDYKINQPTVFIADPGHKNWYRALVWESALDRTKDQLIERGLVYYTAEHAAEKAKAMAGIDPRTTNRGEA